MPQAARAFAGSLLIASCACWSALPRHISPFRLRHAHHPVAVAQQGTPLEVLAKQALAMLASSEEERDGLMQQFDADASRIYISQLLEEFDVSHTGQLEAEEALELFRRLARQLLEETAKNGRGAAAAHAQSLLDEDDAGAQPSTNGALSTAITEMAGHLLRIADSDGDGVVSLGELTEIFEGGALLGGKDGDGDDLMARLADRPSDLTDLYELRGCLQMLPRIARHFDSSELLSEKWHENVAGDSQTLRRWVSPTHAKDGLSIVGMGRSADASCYYLPEWGVVLDAGFATKAFTPKTVLLSHSHRDHMQALPVLARPPPFARSQQGRSHPPMVLLPAPLEPLVRNYLLAESVLNFGTAQTEAENTAALGKLDLVGVADGDVLPLPKHAYSGKRGLSVEVFRAPHKAMPSVAYGLFRTTKRLKPEFADQQHRIGELMRADPTLEVSEEVRERALFYSGDTTIALLEARAEAILQYRYVIHECTFLGPPSAEADEYASSRGHTHYAQLHKYICMAPATVWILVHWSIRYSREDVVEFFESQYGGVPRNVVLWI